MFAAGCRVIEIVLNRRGDAVFCSRRACRGHACGERAVAVTTHANGLLRTAPAQHQSQQAAQQQQAAADQYQRTLVPRSLDSRRCWLRDAGFRRHVRCHFRRRSRNGHRQYRAWRRGCGIGRTRGGGRNRARVGGRRGRCILFKFGQPLLHRRELAVLHRQQALVVLLHFFQVGHPRFQFADLGAACDQIFLGLRELGAQLAPRAACAGAGLAVARTAARRWHDFQMRTRDTGHGRLCGSRRGAFGRAGRRCCVWCGFGNAGLGSTGLCDR